MEGKRSRDVRALADGVGILASVACALHCMAVPLFLIVGTAPRALLAGDETIHQMFLWAVFPAALIAFGVGCWQHRDKRVLLLGALGVLGIFSPIVVSHALIGELGEGLLTTASAGVLVSAHLRNFRMCRASCCAQEGAFTP